MNYVEPAFVGEMKRTRDMLDRSGSTQTLTATLAEYPSTTSNSNP